MDKKQIFVVNVKLKFDNNITDIIPFYIEAETQGKAETKLEQWLLSGKSGFKFVSILSM